MTGSFGRWYRGVPVPSPSMLHPMEGTPPMPEFAVCAIRYASGLPLAVVYDDITCDNTGAVSGTRYWNHAKEGWESGPLDPTKHVLPLQRLAPAGPYAASYALFLAVKPFQTESATATVFNVDAAGALTEVYDHLPRTQALIQAGRL